MHKMSTEDFIKRSEEIHNHKYDYSETVYYGSKEKVKIICPEHGYFFPKASHHIEGQGCPICSRNKRKLTIEEFVRRAKEIHGDKYDYSKVVYVNMDTKVCIICPKHGEFWQTPSEHLFGKHGCEKCYNERRRGKYNMTTSDFIEKAKKVHGDKYDYSETIYKGLKEKVDIICPKHGKFSQVAYDHLRGFNCKECKHEKDRLTLDDFIEKANKKHNNKYDYSKTVYVNGKTKVCITCPKHGIFWTPASEHIYGIGCPRCNYSKMENEVKRYLEELNIDYIEQYRDSELNKLRLDFYLPTLKIGIECQGLQHFKRIEMWDSNNDSFENRQERDKKKYLTCINENIKLIYFYPKQYNRYLKEDMHYIKENAIYTIDELNKYITKLM